MVPSAKDTLLVSLFSVVPKEWTSSRIGGFAASTMSGPLVRYYAWSNGIDLSEAEPSDVAAYETLGALFTRALKPGARPIDRSATVTVVSPCDGEVVFVGCAKGGVADIADGRVLDLRALLGDPQPRDEDDVVVIYLSPKDYHRVHSPADSTGVPPVVHIAGERWPVRPSFMRKIESLFERNERVSMTLQGGDADGLTLTMVAAFGVGHMTWPDGSEVRTGPSAHPKGIERGAWLATFGLGSTVILTAPKGRLHWDLELGRHLKLGEAIARRP